MFPYLTSLLSFDVKFCHKTLEFVHIASNMKFHRNRLLKYRNVKSYISFSPKNIEYTMWHFANKTYKQYMKYGTSIQCYMHSYPSTPETHTDKFTKEEVSVIKVTNTP